MEHVAILPLPDVGDLIIAHDAMFYSVEFDITRNSSRGRSIYDNYHDPMLVISVNLANIDKNRIARMNVHNIICLRTDGILVERYMSETHSHCYSFEFTKIS